MDTKFVISQLVTAVIVMITTIITVRYSQRGELGISPKHKDRLKGIARAYGRILLSLLGIIGAVVMLIFNMRYASIPVTASDVALISFWVTMTLFNAQLLLNAIVDFRYDHKQEKQRQDRNV